MERGWYWLISEEYPEDAALVFYYKNPDMGEHGFGFNIADGCGFLPEKDLAEGTKVQKASVVAPGGLNPYEAVFGFAGWLTTREERTAMSSRDDAAIVAELAAKFCETNNLGTTGDEWPGNLIHPPAIEPYNPTTNKIDETKLREHAMSTDKVSIT